MGLHPSETETSTISSPAQAVPFDLKIPCRVVKTSHRQGFPDASSRVKLPHPSNPRESQVRSMQTYLRSAAPGEITGTNMQNDVGEPLLTTNLSPTSAMSSRSSTIFLFISRPLLLLPEAALFGLLQALMILFAHFRYCEANSNKHRDSYGPCPLSTVDARALA